MDANSKFYDKIRIKKGSKAKSPADNLPKCRWDGCDKPGTHKAPLGRDLEGQYVHFCIDHVRDYNKSYNYFSGLNDDDIANIRKDALTGHRPTWAMGVNKTFDEPPLGNADPRAAAAAKVTAKMRARAGLGPTGSAAGRKLKPLEKKAFDDLGMAHSATEPEIKKRYKALVKQHHPDTNGGDRSTEERLRQIIKSYKILKQGGFCS